jgi:uncharacterized membrane protein YhaH (DUF805 family)
MSFAQAVGSVLSKYATFSGRAMRSEYWWYYLFTILVSIASSVVDNVVSEVTHYDLGIVGAITSLALLVPSLAVTVRRLHDTGRTGWWLLLPVIPFVAMFVAGIAVVFVVAFGAGLSGAEAERPTAAAMVVALIAGGIITLAAIVTFVVFLCLDSQPGPNKYGPSPKQPFLPPGPDFHHPYPYGYPAQQPVQQPAPPHAGFGAPPVW